MEGISCFTLETELAKSPVSTDECCLVMESDPNPDYYAKGNFPPNKHMSKWRLYFIVDAISRKLRENILRQLPLLNKKYGMHIEVSFGEMKLKKEKYYFIKMATSNNEHLHSFHIELEKLGVKFFSNRNIKQGKAHVEFCRYVEYEEIEEGAYVEKGKADRYFFEVARELSQKELKAVIDRIKRNCKFDYFDSFTVTLPDREGVHDFIGIYSNHCDRARLHEFRMELEKVFPS